jgi:CRP-like cAMP-binding protein
VAIAALLTHWLESDPGITAGTRVSRLADQIREAVAAFAEYAIPHALIGGLALAAHKVVRATRDVDFLADADDAERIHDLLLQLGYRCVHRSRDAANYLRGDEGLDLLFAHRPEARRLLDEAGHRDSALGALRVVSAEGLIGFKLQGYVNDPRRVQDIEDIRNLLRVNAATLDMDEVRRYFALFEREALLDDLSS